MKRWLTAIRERFREALAAYFCAEYGHDWVRTYYDQEWLDTGLYRVVCGRVGCDAIGRAEWKASRSFAANAAEWRAGQQEAQMRHGGAVR